MKNSGQIIIIGGGLSGLTLAYLLQQNNIKPIILEASPRLGGRIQTINGTLNTPLELGATWFSDVHLDLLALLENLGLKKFPQFSDGISLFKTKSFEPPQKFVVPASDNPSYRLVNGTQTLIDTLSKHLDATEIIMNTKVIQVSQHQDNLLISTADGKEFIADIAVTCMPPQLVAKQINFLPALPETVNQIMPMVHTWMNGSIKFAVEYDTPFWKENGYSGMLYSHVGLIAEMYDHSNNEESKFGFTGFLNGNATQYNQEERKKIILEQLTELFGEAASAPASYFDKIWSDEFIATGSNSYQRPHQYNGHPELKKSYMGNKLFFSGTETSSSYAGYMEGAIVSAIEVLSKIINVKSAASC